MISIVILSLAVVVLSLCIAYVAYELYIVRRKLNKSVEMFDECTKALALRVDVLNNRCDRLSTIKHYEELFMISKTK